MMRRDPRKQLPGSTRALWQTRTLLTSTALVGACVLLSAPALADGGAGGAQSAANPGGAGGAGFTGNPGADSPGSGFGGGGGGGAGGGSGGVGYGYANSSGGAGGTLASPDGQAGESASLGYGGGGGGGGGFNGNGAGAATITNVSPLTGGNGGAGGNGGSLTGGGGGGGAGGYGAIVTGGGASSNASSITGGNGGMGGASGESSFDFGGNGGDGGVGVQLTATGATFMNSGTVTGGSGGNAGAAAGSGQPGTPGAGGAGIVGASLTIINSGAISGGLSGDGATRANAITFTGGTNRLELHAGSAITGNIVAFSAADTLALGGAGNAGFDVSQIGPAAQYQGFGLFEKTGTSTWTLTGTSAYTGATTVNEGALIVNGSIASSSGLTVNAGALVGGIGILPSTIVNGGILSPGNSIGALTVNGNLVLSSAATYLVEVNAAGQSDRTNVTGTATLGGTVQVVAAPGTYTLGTTYTILTATGGISGTFGAVSSNLPSSDFVGSALTYDASNVFLSWTKVATFASAGQTRNQIATGAAADSLSFGNPIVDTLLSGTAAQARPAFDRLSGEVHASAAGVLLDESRYLRDAVTGRARQSYGGVQSGALAALGTAGPALAYVQETADVSDALGYAAARKRPFAKAPAAPTPNERVLAVWSQAIGAWGKADGDGNAASLDRKLGGFLAGFDATFANAWRLGVAGGYTRSSVDVDARASSASMDNVHLALYGGTQQGPWGLRGGAAFTWHGIDTRRTIAFPGFFDATKARYDARTAQAFGEVGYGVLMGKTAFEPFAAVAHVNLDTGRFRESGGAAALTAGDATLDATFTTLGLRAASVLGFANGMAVTGRGTLGWRHAFGDVTPEMSLAFASGGLPFTIAGAPLARDSAVVEAGLDLDVTADARLGIGYSGQLADTAQDHAVKGSFRWRF